jgi:hypothetical protein
MEVFDITLAPWGEREASSGDARDFQPEALDRQRRRRAPSWIGLADWIGKNGV